MAEHLARVWGPRQPMTEAERILHAEIAATYEMTYGDPERDPDE